MGPNSSNHPVSPILLAIIHMVCTESYGFGLSHCCLLPWIALYARQSHLSAIQFLIEMSKIKKIGIPRAGKKTDRLQFLLLRPQVCHSRIFTYTLACSTEYPPSLPPSQNYLHVAI